MRPDRGIKGESPRRFVVNSVPAGCPPLIAPCEVDAAPRARRGMGEPRQKPPGPNGVTHPQALRSAQRRGAPSPVFVPAASAGPLKDRKRLAFVATCDDGDTVQVVVNGEGGARSRPHCAARRRSSFRRHSTSRSSSRQRAARPSGRDVPTGRSSNTVALAMCDKRQRRRRCAPLRREADCPRRRQRYRISSESRSAVVGGDGRLGHARS
jgi:hypothetical protein